MARQHGILIAAASIALAAASTLAAGGESGVRDADVADAIRRAQAFLYQQQNERGTWDSAKRTSRKMWQPDGVQYGGRTALVTYALLASGEEIQGNEKLTRAVAFLEKTPFTGSYAMGFRAHVWSHLPNRYNRFLIRDMNRLIRGQAEDGDKIGTHHYHLEATTGGDHSVTQYATLGIWESAKRGHRVPDEYWQRLEKHFLKAQNFDGGWGYLHGQPSRGSMTAAGLTVLYITQDYLHGEGFERAGNDPAPAVSSAIKKGLNWFAQHFAVDEHPGGPDKYLTYYLLGVERVGEASGLTAFNGEDWYRAGAAHLLKTQQKDGSWDAFGPVVDTAFATVFLSRGRRPVALGKLRLAGAAWNNRPRDAAHFVDWLSGETERSLSWQVVDFSAPPERWLETPVVLLAGRGALDLSEAQLAAMRQYVRLGGLVVTSADGGDETFDRAARELAGALFPGEKLTPVAADDPLYQLVYHPEPRMAPAWSVHNGARHLLVHLPGDLTWAMHRRNWRGADHARELLANIYHYATEKGRVRTRLASLPAQRDPSVRPTARGTVGRLRYDGRWDPEPAAWSRLAVHLWNERGWDVGTGVVDLAAVDECKLPMVHLAGVGEPSFSLKEAAAVRRYVEGGGVLLIEPVGGDERFERAAKKLIAAALPEMRIRPVSKSADLLRPDEKGGIDLRRVGYTRYTRQRFGQLSHPRIQVGRIDGKVRVILSEPDLSLAWLDQPVWGAHGFSTESARGLAINLLLTTGSLTPVEPAQAATQPADPAEPADDQTKPDSTDPMEAESQPAAGPGT